MKGCSRTDFGARQSRRRAEVGLAWMLLAAPLLAADGYLAPHQPDAVALLPPPPAANSSEQAADLASVRAVFQATPLEERERAEKDAALTIFRFAPAIGEFFRPGQLPRTEALFERVKASIREPVNTAKTHWQRLRPYAVDPKLKFGRGEPSFSYPSGHATVGTVQALILADLFPAHREAILEIGRRIGWDRVVTGKHYPTDVYAGRTLGQAIVRKLKANPEFQRDFAAAKAELDAAQAAAAKLSSGPPDG
jgi:acid phosphatase (class A)